MTHAVADRAVEAAAGVELALGDLAQPRQRGRVVAVLGPQVGVGREHAVEGHHAAAAGLVHQVEPDADLLRLALLDDAVAELGVVRGVHLVDVQQDHVVADDEVGQVAHVVDRHVVADVAGDDQAVGDAGRHLQLVVLQHDALQPADPHQPGELAVLDQVRGERVGHQELVPVVAGVAVLHQRLDLVARRAAASVRGPEGSAGPADSIPSRFRADRLPE